MALRASKLFLFLFIFNPCLSLSTESGGYCDNEGILDSDCQSREREINRRSLQSSRARIRSFAGPICTDLQTYDACRARSGQRSNVCQQPCGTGNQLCDNPASAICSASPNNPNKRHIDAARAARETYDQARSRVFARLRSEFNDNRSPCNNLPQSRETQCKERYNELMMGELYENTEEARQRKRKIEQTFQQAKQDFLAYLNDIGASRELKNRINSVTLSFDYSTTSLFKYTASATSRRDGSRQVKVGGTGLFVDNLQDSLYQIIQHELAHHGDAQSFSANVGNNSTLGLNAEKCMTDNVDAGDNQDIVTEAMADAVSMEVYAASLRRRNRLMEPPAVQAGNYGGAFFDRRKGAQTNGRLFWKMASILAPKCLYDDQQVLDGGERSRARRIEYAESGSNTHPHFEDRINRVFMAHPSIRYELGCENYYGNISCMALDGSCAQSRPEGATQTVYYGQHCPAVETEGGTGEFFLSEGTGGGPNRGDLPLIRTETDPNDRNGLIQ